MSRPRLLSQLPEHRHLVVTGMSGRRPAITAPVVHPHASLALITGGRTRVYCGSTYDLAPGDVLLVPEGLPHYGISATAPEGIGLALCTSCLTSTAGERLGGIFADVAAGASAQRTLDPDAAERLRWILEALRGELSTARGWQSLAIDGYLALISATLLRATPAARLTDGRTAEASLSARALAFVTHNATRGISLTDVAHHIHRSAAHTSTVVKAETGRTVVEWITHARLATARELLLRTDETIEAVADRVGFASPSHFHRTFRRHHQATPARWRAAHRAPASG